jgi:MFS family permease
VSSRLTPVQWLICVIAAIGFAFDIYELLMWPLIVEGTLGALVGAARGTDLYNYWAGMLFWIPAIVGGAFGLVGGYLTDRLGRRRVLTWSILIYAFSALAAGYSTNIWQFLIFRCTTWIGVCVEFVAAVAWLAEIFAEPKQRERVLGYTQAFSSVGGLLVTGVNAWIVANATSLPQVFGGHEAWRYTLMSGVVPALPLIVIRPFLPESPVWQQKKAAGTLRRPHLSELFSPALRRVTIVTTLMFAMSYGAAFGAIQQMPQIVRGTPDVANMTLDRPVPADPAEAKVYQAELARLKARQSPNVQWWQEIGGLAGRTLLAMLVVIVASRRGLLRIFQVPGLIVVPLLFWMAPTSSLMTLKIGMFFAGVFTVAQFSFWGNYLPRVYPTHLRGTGEGFAANVGGRMLGTGFAFVTLTLSGSLSGPPHVQLATAAAMVALFVYAAGFALSFFLPEPKGEALPE